MIRVTIDQAIRAKLHNLMMPLEICDETGNTRGYFRPIADPDLYKDVQVPISEQELQRREREGSGRPLHEILKDLEKRQ